MSTPILALIPARSGSKGVRDKNIIELAGRPLLSYTVQAAKLCRNIDRVIVSTDSEYYADIAREWGAEVPFLRPAAISSDSSSDIDFIRHALDWLGEHENWMPDFIIHLRVTTPIRKVGVIEDAIEMFLEDSDRYTALRSVHEMSQTSYKTFEIRDGTLRAVFTGNADIESLNRPRQSFPQTYDANGYVDIIKTSSVREGGYVHGDRVLGYVTDFTPEVDTADDYSFMRFWIQNHPDLIQDLFAEGA